MIEIERHALSVEPQAQRARAVRQLHELSHLDLRRHRLRLFRRQRKPLHFRVVSLAERVFRRERHVLSHVSRRHRRQLFADAREERIVPERDRHGLSLSRVASRVVDHGAVVERHLIVQRHSLAVLRRLARRRARADTVSASVTIRARRDDARGRRARRRAKHRSSGD